MRSLIQFVAVLVFSFSLSVSEAQNKVVVIPMGGSRTSGVLASTGQTLCYDPACTTAPCNPFPCTGTGEDGEFQAGVTVSPRFIDNNDGTVTDKLTGLVWLQEGNCTTFFAGDATGQNPRNWQAALAASGQLSTGYCNLTDGSVAGDWRLPNIRELHSLVDFSQFDPTLPSGHPFLHTEFSIYWSSTSGSLYTEQAWLVNFHDGRVTDGNRGNSYNVRAVRGGQ